MTLRQGPSAQKASGSQLVDWQHPEGLYGEELIQPSELELMRREGGSISDTLRRNYSLAFKNTQMR